MSWESFERSNDWGHGQGEARYGSGWVESPAISITKTGISFNEKFVRSFVNGHRGMRVFVDKEGGRIGFRPCEAGEAGSFSFKPSTKSGCSQFSIPRLAKLLSTQHGKAFAAKLNAIDNVVEVSLTEVNQLVAP